MTWLSALAVLAAWAVQQADSQRLLAVSAVLWLALLVLVWFLGGRRPALVLLAVCWTLVRAGWHLEAGLPVSLERQDVLVSGCVDDFARVEADATRFVLVTGDDGSVLAPGSRIHLGWYQNPPVIRPGQRWQLKVRLRTPRGLANPAAFDFEHWLYLRRISAVGYVRPSRLTRQLGPGSGSCRLGRLRERVVTRVEAALDGHPATAYVTGVVAGALSGISAADWEVLRQTGTIHLLAISGLNVAMVAAPWMLLGVWAGRIFPAVGRMRHAGLLAGLCAAGAYAALAGFAVSTVRASIMLAIFAAMTVVRRRTTVIEVLALAALAQIVIDPFEVTSAGFALSFMGVAWLTLVSGWRRDRERPSPALSASGLFHSGADLWRAQLVLGMGLGPLLMAWFQQVSLIAPLTNLVAVPVFTLVVMPLALAGSALLFIAPIAGALLLEIAAAVVGQLMELMRLAADSGLAIWKPAVVKLPAVWLAQAAAVLLCWWRPVPWRASAMVLLVPLVFGIRAGTVPALKITITDVGQGLAVLVQTPGHALLYDAGPAYGVRDAGESVVEPVLRHAGVSRLDAIVLSHEDLDHSGGVRSVMALIPTRLVVAPKQFLITRVPFLACREGMTWTWDEVSFRMLSPPGSGSWDSDNDSSCVLRIDTRYASVLLPGDIHQARERALRAGGQLRRADLVVAPHHGSRSSSGSDLVEATRPRFVVFSAGHANRWGFPAGEVHRRWVASGACVLNTATEGAMVFATSPAGSLQLVQRQRADAAHLWTSAIPRGQACTEEHDD